jgi:hypothetical protein
VPKNRIEKSPLWQAALFLLPRVVDLRSDPRDAKNGELPFVAGVVQMVLKRMTAHCAFFTARKNTV